MTRRNAFDWDMAILKVCLKPRLLTQAMYKVNVNCNILKKRLELLTAKGFITQQANPKKSERRIRYPVNVERYHKNGRTIYATTQTGKEMLRLHLETRNFYCQSKPILEEAVAE